MQNHLGRLQEDERVDKPDETLGRAETTLEGLLASDPDRPELLVPLAEVHHNRGMYFGDHQQWSKAKEHLSKGLEIRRRLKEELARDADFKQRLSRCYDFLDGSGQSPSGEDALERALALSYGWLGDVQQALGEDPRESYGSASDIRQASFTKHPTAKTLYLHARDFGNMGNYYDRAGEVEKAIDQYRLRLDCYENHRDISTADLPQNYRDEPAGTARGRGRVGAGHGPERRPGEGCPVAERRRSGLPGLAQERAGRGPPSPFGRVSPVVCRPGQTGRVTNLPNEAQKLADKAEQLFASLDQQHKARADDDYYWALACAIRARLAVGDARTLADEDALNHLESAVNNNFNQRKRLERDRCLLEPYADPQKPRFDKLFGRVQ